MITNELDIILNDVRVEARWRAGIFEYFSV